MYILLSYTRGQGRGLLHFGEHFFPLKISFLPQTVQKDESNTISNFVFFSHIAIWFAWFMFAGQQEEEGRSPAPSLTSPPPTTALILPFSLPPSLPPPFKGCVYVYYFLGLRFLLTSRLLKYGARILKSCLSSSLNRSSIFFYSYINYQSIITIFLYSKI